MIIISPLTQDGHSNCQAFRISFFSALCLSKGREWSLLCQRMEGKYQQPLSYITAFSLFSVFKNLQLFHQTQRAAFLLHISMKGSTENHIKNAEEQLVNIVWSLSW